MAGLKTRAEALEALGLADMAPDDAVRAAFRQRLKRVHPDMSGGSDAQLRRLILARDLLISNDSNSTEQSDLHQEFNTGKALNDNAVHLTVSLHRALFGGFISIDVPALEFAEADECPSSLIQSKKLHITLPAGLRDGATVSLACAAPGTRRLFRIHIETGDDCRVWGNDIWMTARIEQRVLRSGGRSLIDTPHGPQDIDIPPRTFSGASLCLKCLGLPVTDTAPAGDLHIRLESCPDSLRPAGHILNDFRQRWAS